jgi:hypothetical protein
VYPKQEELLGSEPLLKWIDGNFLRSDPFAFSEVGFKSVVGDLSDEFDIDPNGIYCIGSGAVGLSLNPTKIRGSALKPFDAASDLDLALISEVHFETAWRDLRRASQPSVAVMDSVIRENISWQKKRFFDGAIVANALLPAISFGPEWLEAHVRISERVAVMLNREIDVHFWIYRDYWSVRNYVAESIVKCRKKLVVT